MRNEKLRVLIEGALLIAIAEVLSRVSPGGETYFSISLGMIPILFFALRRGWKYGVFIGLLYGMFKIVLGNLWAIHWAQVLIEYTIPYFSLGFAGIVSKPLIRSIQLDKVKSGRLYIIAGAFIGGIARYFWHFIAGFIFWGEYAPDGMNPFWYSFIFNGAHMLQGTIVAIILLLILHAKASYLFVPKK